MHFAPDHVGIIVSDVDRSKAFYSALGFEPESEYDDGTKTLVFLKGPRPASRAVLLPRDPADLLGGWAARTRLPTPRLSRRGHR